MGIGSESDCLLGLSNKILETSYSEVGLKTEKSGGATGGEGECGEVEEELLASCLMFAPALLMLFLKRIMH